MFYENVKKLCQNNGLTLTDLCRALKLSTSKPTYWKGGTTPKPEHLIEIADFFGVSIDFLIRGNDDNEKSSPLELSDDELELLMLYRRLNYMGQDKAIKYIGDLLDSPKNLKGDCAASQA